MNREILAREIHKIYQDEAKRQNDIRHSDNFDTLPEHIKNYDYKLADWIVELIKQAEVALLKSIPTESSWLDEFEEQIIAWQTTELENRR